MRDRKGAKAAQWTRPSRRPKLASQVRGGDEIRLAARLQVQGQDGGLGTAGGLDGVVGRLQVLLLEVREDHGGPVAAAGLGNRAAQGVGDPGDQDDAVFSRLGVGWYGFIAFSAMDSAPWRIGDEACTVPAAGELPRSAPAEPELAQRGKADPRSGEVEPLGLEVALSRRRGSARAPAGRGSRGPNVAVLAVGRGRGRGLRQSGSVRVLGQARALGVRPRCGPVCGKERRRPGADVARCRGSGRPGPKPRAAARAVSRVARSRPTHRQPARTGSPGPPRRPQLRRSGAGGRRAPPRPGPARCRNVWGSRAG